MLDRVREALFSTLTPWLAPPGPGADPETGAHVLDLFAGTGSLGLEALSRGAAHARFVERDEAAAALLSANVKALGVGRRARVVKGDALARASWGDERSADVVFLDPPYPFLSEEDTRRAVLEAFHALVRDVLAPEGVLVLHVPRGRLRDSDFAADVCARERLYGTNALWYAQREEDA